MKRILMLLGLLFTLVIAVSAQEFTSTTENSDVNLQVSHPENWSVQVVPDFGFSLMGTEDWLIVIGVGEGITGAFEDPTGTSPIIAASDALPELVKDFNLDFYDLNAAETITLPQGNAIRINGSVTVDEQIIPAMIITFNLPDERLVAAFLMNQINSQDIDPDIYADFEAIVGTIETISTVTTPANAVAIAEMPAGTVVFNSGVSLPLPDGWSLYSDEPFIRDTAVIYTGTSYLSAGSFAIVTVNQVSELPIESYRDFVLSFTAMLYTGREDFDVERDILTETLDDGREIQFLDVSDAETPMGNAFLIPINESVYVAIIATVTSGDEVTQINEQFFEIARNITFTEVATPEPAAISLQDLTPVASTCERTISTSDINSENVLALFECPAGCADEYYAAWGTDVYTLDSYICAAAIHSGAISNAEGGLILLTWLPGQSEYPASDRNGISTSRWGSWDNSFKAEPFSPDADQ